MVIKFLLKKENGDSMNEAMFSHLEGLGKFKVKKLIGGKARMMKKFSKPPATWKKDKKKQRARELDVSNEQYRKDARQAREDYNRASDRDYKPFWNEKYESPWKEQPSQYRNVQDQSAGSSLFAPQQSAPQASAPQQSAPQVLSPVESAATDYSALVLQPAFDFENDKQDSSALEYSGFIPADSDGITEKTYDIEPFSFSDKSSGFDGIPDGAKAMVYNVKRKNPLLGRMLAAELLKHDLTAGRGTLSGLGAGEQSSVWADLGKGLATATGKVVDKYADVMVAKAQRRTDKIIPPAERARIYDSYAGQARNQLSTSSMGDSYPLYLMAGVLGIGYLLLRKK